MHGCRKNAIRRRNTPFVFVLLCFSAVWAQTSWHSIVNKCFLLLWQLVWAQTAEKQSRRTRKVHFWLSLLGAKLHLKCSFFVIIRPFDINHVVTELYTSALHCPDNLFEVKRPRNDEERTYKRCIFAPTPPHQRSYNWCMYVVCELFDLKQVDTALHTSVFQHCSNLFAVKRSINNKERTKMVCFSS